MTILKIVVFTISVLSCTLVHYLLSDEAYVIYAQDNDIKKMKQEFPSHAKSEQLNWIDDDDNNTLSASTETNEPISGTGSLRVDIKPASSMISSINYSWSVITTDFMPANENTSYNYSLDVSAKDVNQLHSKIYYYDSSNMVLSENFIFGGKDGTFKGTFSNTFLTQIGTKYLQFQMWVKPTSGRNASFLIDNVNLGKNETYDLNNIQNITEKVPTQSISDNKGSIKMPFIANNDSSFSIERIFTGLNFPTSMAFLGPNDILVLEKNQGMVKRIVNGNMLRDPLLDVNVANKGERGMLGIDISKQEINDNIKPIIYVFLYYTETKLRDGEDLVSTRLADIPGQGPIGNRLYRYELVNDKLAKPKLLLDIPAEPKPNHQGGVVQIGPDNNVYVVIGDVDHFTRAQNYRDGEEPDGTGGILRITQDGKAVGNGVIGNTHPLNLYYAYGIRNSFGMDFDPVTGNLWDTENGLRCCDEINLVKKGFNSGWDKVQGFWKTNHSQNRDSAERFDEKSNKELELVTFDGNGKYISPEFVWNITVAPTAMKFFSSTKFGQEYKDDLFIGTANEQNIYHFDLTKDRTELNLNGNLSDKIAESTEDLASVVFAEGFGRITDLDIGPDGNLYVLSFPAGGDENFRNGTIFKISRTSGYD